MNKQLKYLAIAFLSILFTQGIYAQDSTQAAQIFSDNMVLQRDLEVPIWGTSIPGDQIKVTFDGTTVTTTTSRKGDWLVKLPQHVAGGPFKLKIEGRNETTFSNVMVGDVWIAGGQSNMEFSTNNVINAKEELQNANIHEIRLLNIYTEVSEKPRDTFSGTKWEVCTPETAEWFSAVGFLFARNIHQEYNIPVGIISSNCGGTNVETWTSMEAMMAFEKYKRKIEEVRKMDLVMLLSEQEKEKAIWNSKVLDNDPGDKAKWYNSSTDFSGWDEMELPGNWESAGFPQLDGSMWYVKEFELSAQEAQKGITLHLSKVDDGDYSYVNGTLVGSTALNHNEMRIYTVKPQLLKEGKNTLVVKVVDYGGGGGMWGDKAEMYVETGIQKISLAGTWKYHIGVNSTAPTIKIGANDYPGLLFNAMIAPVVGYGIKGVIWYQGEANVHNASEYFDHFTSMISDWRKQWNQGDFPFLFVQLANYNAAETWDDGDWATVREAQLKTLSELKNTGMAVSIDIGNSNDIHPKNKQDVAKRLFLAAKHIAYNEQLEYSGPIFKSMEIANGKINISFDHVAKGLTVKGKKITGIEIAGNDQQFVKASAKIKGDQLIVWSSKVKEPDAVRYGWAQDPRCNLYNSENLPASPFRTDTW